MDKELLKKVLSNKAQRIVYLQYDFFSFFVYYFAKHIKYKEFSEFQKEWFKTAITGKNIYVEGHRESAKTTILGMAFEIRKICYKKANFICNLCYDKTKAKAFNKLIAVELLQNKQIIEDFGVLYSRKKKDYEEDDIQESGISGFVTTNDIRVKAFGMGETLRGEVHNSKLLGNVRPDHLNLDDIDNNKNTKNINIIKNDMNFLLTEVFGGLSKDGHQIICLGNVIRKDGRNPRIKSHFKNSDNWKIFSNFIYGEAGKQSGAIQWSRFVETVGEKTKENQISLEEIKQSEKSGYYQNWLGIPLLVGQTIIKEEWIIYNTELVEFDYYIIGLDPAFSKKTNSDAFGIVVTGYKKIKGDIYKKAVYCKKLEGIKKDTGTAINIIKSLYHKYEAKTINIEGNNGGEILGELLKKEGLSVDIMRATRDKVSRFKQFEGDLMRGLIYFAPETEELVNEALEFTGEDGGDDNLVDAWVWSLKASQKEFVFF